MNLIPNQYIYLPLSTINFFDRWIYMNLVFENWDLTHKSNDEYRKWQYLNTLNTENNHKGEGRGGGVRKPQILLKIITKGRAGGSENPKSLLRNTWMVHPTNRVFNCLIWFIKKGKVNPWVNGQNVSSKATCNNCRYN